MTTLKTLNDKLFDQLDRISSCDSKDLECELDRSGAIVEISAEIVKVHQLKFNASALYVKHKGLPDNQEPININGW